MNGITIRPGTEADYPYVFSSFAREWPRICGHGDETGKLGTSLLEPMVTAWSLYCAVPEHDQSLVLGWILVDGNRVAWVTTHRSYRKQGFGIADMLLAHAGIRPGPVITPFMPSRIRLRKYIESKGYKLQFRPWLPLQVKDWLARLSSGIQES